MLVFMAPTALTGESSELAWFFSLNPAAQAVLTVSSSTSASLSDAASGIRVEFAGAGFSAALGQPRGGTVNEIRAYRGDVLQVTAQPVPALAFNLIRSPAFAAAFEGQSNTIYDNGAREILVGGNQSDTLFSNLGDDTLYGGDGDDSFGVDDAAILPFPSPFPGGRSLRIYGGDGNDQLVVGNTNAVAGGGLANLVHSDFVSVERVVLSKNAVLRVNGYVLSLPNHLGHTIESAGGTRLEVEFFQVASFDFDTLTYNVSSGSHSNVAYGSYLSGTLSGADAWSDTLYAGDGNDSVEGRGGDDFLAGGGENDTIVGGAGADTMVGDNGADIFYVEDSTDVVIEILSGGYDKVVTTVDLALQRYVEEAEAAGMFNVTLRGNAMNNRLDGNGGHNHLMGIGGDDLLNGFGGNDTTSGGIGNDTLDGGTGNDQMAGAIGDDLYYVDATRDVVVEGLNSGNDTIYSSVSLTLVANVENAHLLVSGLTLRGNSLANALHGNNLNNVLSSLGGNDFLAGGLGDDALNGGAGNDTLNGGVGRDTLISGAGSDQMVGGAGNDVFVIGDGDGDDFIFNFGRGGTEADLLSLKGVTAITDYADLVAHHLTQNGADVRIDLGTGEILTLTSTMITDLTASNFLF